MIRVPVLLALAMTAVGCASTPEATSPERSGSVVERVSPNRAAELNTRLGVGYLEKGDLQIALEKLEKAVSQDPDHAPARLALGIVYESIGRQELALEQLRRAVRLAPDDGAAHNSYAALLCRAGRYEEADRHFRAALEDPFYPTPDIVLANAGACARRDGRTETAEAYLRRALDIDPMNRVALFHLSSLSYEIGEPLRARAFLQRLAETGPLSPQSLLLGYRVERRLGAADSARGFSQRLQSQYPDSPEANELRGQGRDDG
ncbi:MAG: type IV pilus biogenesis/stability protein PilW [Wenzhouxiangellaceae bacterium]|nr:type IV pilus biogenesis/stability protein PilW [Wenzhouxiangellaceae bacterium]